MPNSLQIAGTNAKINKYNHIVGAVTLSKKPIIGSATSWNGNPTELLQGRCRAHDVIEIEGTDTSTVISAIAQAHNNYSNTSLNIFGTYYTGYIEGGSFSYEAILGTESKTQYFTWKCKFIVTAIT